MEKFDIGQTPDYDQYERKRVQQTLPSPVVRRSLFDLMSSTPSEETAGNGKGKGCCGGCFSWWPWRCRRRKQPSGVVDDYTGEPLRRSRSLTLGRSSKRKNKTTTKTPIADSHAHAAREKMSLDAVRHAASTGQYGPSAYHGHGYYGTYGTSGYGTYRTYGTYGSVRTLRYQALPNPDDKFGSYGRVGGYEFGTEGWRYERKSLEQRRWEEREKEERREKAERRRERKASEARSMRSAPSARTHSHASMPSDGGTSRNTSISRRRKDSTREDGESREDRHERKDSSRRRHRDRDRDRDREARRDSLPERRDSTRREHGRTDSAASRTPARTDSMRSNARSERKDSTATMRSGKDSTRSGSARRREREREYQHHHRDADADAEWQRLDQRIRSERERLPPPLESAFREPGREGSHSALAGAAASPRRRGTRRRNINTVQYIDFFEDPNAKP